MIPRTIVLHLISDSFQKKRFSSYFNYILISRQQEIQHPKKCQQKLQHLLILILLGFFPEENVYIILIYYSFKNPGMHFQRS